MDNSFLKNIKNIEIDSKHRELQENVESFLTLPDRIGATNEDKNLPKDLGKFLVERDFIKGVDVWRGSWGFKYNSEDKKISIAENEMSKENYDYYIFRLGLGNNGESLFPKYGIETDQYRFLHEAGHAYQSYLVKNESSVLNIDPMSWYNESIKGEDNSTFSMLFNLCYKIRSVNENRGLSTWGNVPDYNAIDGSSNRIAMRALEDANELVVMKLWHPKYLETFLDYVSLKINGCNESNLESDRLVKLGENTKSNIKEIIDLYIEEMKHEINKK
ncbi:MAG: hypothetical protein NTX85_01190 [Candidatus Nomurabacteria bacterium]|nr:hypothetical protein [Candidatus Nomurabacteria bacterium]